MACGLLEVSRTPCSSWTDVSGSSQSVTAEQTRISGETYTLDGDYAIIAGGKREPIEIAVAIVYTEIDGEAFEFVRSSFEQAGCGPDFCLRWSPRGGSAGDALYSTEEGVLVALNYPPMDATSGDPILAGFTLKVARIVTSVVAPS
jgi:hypothetical protein